MVTIDFGYRGDWEKEKQSKLLFSRLCFLTVAFLKVTLQNRKRYWAKTVLECNAMRKKRNRINRRNFLKVNGGQGFTMYAITRFNKERRKSTLVP